MTARAASRISAASRGHGLRVLRCRGVPRSDWKIIVGGYCRRGLVGVACLNVARKAIDKVLLAGIPCMAVAGLLSERLSQHEKVERGVGSRR